MKLNHLEQKLGNLAFGRLGKLLNLGKQLLTLMSLPAHVLLHGKLRALVEWLTVPFTLWLVDVQGLGKHVAWHLENGRPIDDRIPLLLEQLQELPSQEEQDHVAELEYEVERGVYEALMRNDAKFAARQRELEQDESLKREWAKIKSLFKVELYVNERGVIRRTHLQERGFRPSEWLFFKQQDRERWLFQAFFDIFAFRYDLYGMRGDTPLLQRPTVNRVPYGSIIFVPRFMNLDIFRDLNLHAYRRVHWNPDLQRQGPKASLNRIEREEQLRRVFYANEEALAQGLTGKERFRFIISKAGLSNDMSSRAILQMIKEARELLVPTN